MAEEGPSRPAWWWHALVIGLALHAGLAWELHRRVFSASRDVYDGTWHLTTGRIIHETGSVPRADPLCFTSDGLDWTQLDWLSDLVLYRSYLLLGFAGPAALASTVVVLTLIVLLGSMRLRGAGPLATLLALAPPALLLAAMTDLRPRMASYLALAFTLWLLDARPDPERRFGWGRAAALAALLLLWDQLHAEVALGYAVLLLDAGVTTWASRRAGGGWLPRRSALLLGAIGVGLLGFLLHPHGWDAVRALVHGSSRPSPWLLASIGDGLPLVFRGYEGRLLEAALVAVAGGLALGGPRPGARDALIALGLLHLTLTYQQRLLAPLLVASAPWIAATVSGALLRAPPALRGALAAIELRLGPGVRWLGPGLAAILAGWMLLFLPGRAARGVPGQLSPAWGAVPIEAALALRRSGAQGRIFNELGAGGLLGWVLYPERRVFIDGRTGLHQQGPAVEDYYRIAGVLPGWRERLDAWRIDLVLMARDRPLPNALRELGWRVLHEDQGTVLLGRPE